MTGTARPRAAPPGGGIDPAPGDRRATAAAFAAIAATAVIDIAVPSDVPCAVALGIVAPAASGGCSTRQVAAVSATATVTAAFLVQFFEGTTAVSKSIHVMVVAMLGLVALAVTATRLRRERQLRRARSVAVTLQNAVLEPLPASLPGLEIASMYLAAEAGTLIGGDLYAVVDAPHGVRVLVGDVRGKGIPAVTTAAALMASFHESAYHVADLPEVASRLERRIQRLGPEQAGPPDERFATALLLAVDHDRLRMVSCGHTPPLLLRDGVAVELEVPETAPPLGLGQLHPGGAKYLEHSVEFRAGDTLVAITDGVVEARDRDGRFYPAARRLAPWSRSHPRQVVLRLRRDLRAHVGGALQDDAAAIVIRRAGAG